MGRSREVMTRSQFRELEAHFMKVNGLTRTQYEEYAASVWMGWEHNVTVPWSQDLSWFTDHPALADRCKTCGHKSRLHDVLGYCSLCGRKNLRTLGKCALDCETCGHPKAHHLAGKHVPGAGAENCIECEGVHHNSYGEAHLDIVPDDECSCGADPDDPDDQCTCINEAYIYRECCVLCGNADDDDSDDGYYFSPSGEMYPAIEVEEMALGSWQRFLLG
jgi:hypothetical protein